MKKLLLSVASVLAGVIGCSIYLKKKYLKQLENIKKMSDKHLCLYMMMNQWVKVKQQNRNVADFLTRNEYNRIAIYGMNYVGETLVGELQNQDIEIAYGIDKNAENMYSNFEILSVNDNLEKVDVVIVTPIFYFDEIAEELSDKLDCPILSLEDILYEV